jgi:penicillin-binding protein 2B
MKTRNSLNQPWNFPKRVFKVFLVFIMLLFAQLTYLSVFPNIYGINMDAFAKQRNTVEKKLYAARGNIYDRDKNILALNVASYTVIAFLDASRTGSSKRPLHVVDKEMTAKALAPVLNMTEEYLLNLLNGKGYQVELGPGGRGITELKKEEIEDLGLPGIAFMENHKRNYPNGDFASYILGYAKQYEEIKEVDGIKETIYDIVGELGIESKYNDLLKGVDGKLIFQRDRFGYKIPDTKETRIDAVNGNDIYLTLDASIQRFIEGELKNAAKEFDPEWMQLTVMDAKTGAILGTSSVPSFDPNIRNITNYENPLISYVYEPGSTMKTYAYMCAIEKGTYKGSDTFLSGTISVGGHTVGDWNGKGWGTITYDKGYEFSSNVGIANLLQTALNKNDLRECYNKYGFGEKTGIELPREQVGSLKFNYEIEVVAAGYGQGITTTAIQQLQALTMLANNGSIVKPYIVEKIIDPNTNETVFEHGIQKSEQVIKTSTVNTMKDLMHNVIYGNDVGTTGGSYKIEGFDIIGKTGTSQIYDPKTGRYLNGTNDYIYSFAGMYPKDEPEIIIYAAMKKPTWGKNLALTRATTGVMKSVAKYLNMFGDNEEEGSIIKYELPSYINKNIEQVITDLEEKNIVPIVIGEGTRVIKQFPNRYNTVLSYDKVFLVTNDYNIKMPSVIGWSRSEIINLCNLLGIKYELDGYGYVTEQSITKGTVLTKEDILLIKLEEKFKLDDKNHQQEQAQ